MGNQREVLKNVDRTLWMMMIRVKKSFRKHSNLKRNHVKSVSPIFVFSQKSIANLLCMFNLNSLHSNSNRKILLLILPSKANRTNIPLPPLKHRKLLSV